MTLSLGVPKSMSPSFQIWQAWDYGGRDVIALVCNDDNVIKKSSKLWVVICQGKLPSSQIWLP